MHTKPQKSSSELFPLKREHARDRTSSMMEQHKNLDLVDKRGDGTRPGYNNPTTENRTIMRR